MEIRTLQEDEASHAFYVSSQAFMHGTRDDSWLKDPNRPEIDAYGVFDEGGLQTTVVVVHFQVQLGPTARVPMGGIQGVASLPASRGRGYAAACLKHALVKMKEGEYVISALYPFSWAYYRRLGWEWIGTTRRYTADTRALRTDPETARVRATGPDDREAIRQVYERFAQRYRGMVIRTANAWNQILDNTDREFTFTYLYVSEDGPEGYLTYRGGTRENTGIRELIALTPAAQRALLGLLHRHEMQVSKFNWAAPVDDGLWFQACHWDVETRITPTVQGRVVDVPAALAAWTPASEYAGRLTVGISDSCAPWNTGVWAVEYEGGQVQVKPTTADPQVEMDIQAFTQAFHGTPDVGAIRQADRMTVHDEVGYQALQNLLDGPPAWLNDSF